MNNEEWRIEKEDRGTVVNVTALELACPSQFVIRHSSFVIVWLFAIPLLAQDQVVLQTEATSSRITVSCEILDFTGELLTVRFKNGSGAKTYPADQVLEVRTKWLETHEQGRKLLADRKVPDAVTALQSALFAESRPWVRREILVLLIRCALQTNDRVAAGTRFLSLLESDSTTRHFGLIPLVWAPEQVTDAAKAQARAWLQSESDAARLIGASLLLNETGIGDTAHQELKTLQRSTDERIRQLAQAQTWRLKLRALDVNELELSRWDARVREMPARLRGGPSYLLGRGWTMCREHERAATAFLWLTLMDEHDPRLAARAGVEAADALKRMGQVAQAERLLREVAARFPDTEFGEAAQARP
jgi:hypothetical protein